MLWLGPAERPSLIPKGSPRQTSYISETGTVRWLLCLSASVAALHAGARLHGSSPSEAGSTNSHPRIVSLYSLVFSSSEVKSPPSAGNPTIPRRSTPSCWTILRSSTFKAATALADGFILLRSSLCMRGDSLNLLSASSDASPLSWALVMRFLLDLLQAKGHYRRRY